MITKKTVLVLGAGASGPYGFRTGAGLRNWAVTQIQNAPASPLIKVLSDLGYEERHRNDFAGELRHAGTASIDLFLESRDEFMPIGKSVIACGLIEHEVAANLFVFPEDGLPGSWYWYLIQRLGDKPDQFRKNQLSIVTFNYDRSLEYYLFTALKSRWKLSDEAAWELLKVIPIVHVYGQLGKLHELEGRGRPYRPDLSPESINAAVGEMQILHEADLNSSALAQARKLLLEAHEICFLGFGYHPTNLERLEVKNLGSRHVIGTAYKLEFGETHAAREAFGSVSIDLVGAQQDVLLLLRSTPILA